jgi:hypothetical protein
MAPISEIEFHEIVNVAKVSLIRNIEFFKRLSKKFGWEFALLLGMLLADKIFCRSGAETAITQQVG